MLKRFTVENYKNFQDPVTLDFSKVGKYKFNENCLSEGYLGKMMIYGKNGTGKTNFGRAMVDIRELLFFSRFHRRDDFIKNANAEKEEVIFTYVFQWGKDEVEYEYQKNEENELVAEKLVLNGKEIFYLCSENKEVAPAKLKKLGIKETRVQSYFEALQESGESFDLSFLRWLLNNTAYTPSSILGKIREEVRGMHYIQTSKRGNNVLFRLRDIEEEYDKLEVFLNKMGMKCKLKLIDDPVQEKMNLYFDFKRPVEFFGNASSGTLALTEFFFRFYPALKNTSILILDEFDAFFHYEMSENFFLYLKENYPNVQLVFTTHNTDLMSNGLLRPDCIFILSTEGKLTPLDQATERELREGHNLEKMYHSGEFADYE